jgi:hypothetical protein
MTFIVETFINPKELINPGLLATRFDNFDNYLKEAQDALTNQNANLFFILKNNLNTRILDLFDAYTRLATDTTRLSTNLTNIKAQLDVFKNNNNELKQELEHMNDLSDGSSELINDYKQLYNINYTRNWGIFLSIIFSCYVMSTMFKSKQITI